MPTNGRTRPRPLNAAQQAEFRRRLKARFREVWHDVQRELARSDPGLYQRVAGEVHDLEEASVADLVVDLDHADTGRDLRELREIDAALIRIAEGSFGLCADCGGEIGLPRLNAQPTARRCVRCQAHYEATYAHPAGPKL